jgi:hypothetical protein
MAAAWSRVTGRGAAANAKPLAADLKKVTHSAVLDIPKELFTPVVEASNFEEDRREIMSHLRACLSEPSGKHWHRITGGLALLEALLKSGSPSLIVETAEGRHFDLVQRLSFLEHWDYSDKRVMNMVRSKSEALRKQVVPLIENAALKDSEDALMETASTCSPGSASTLTKDTSSTCSKDVASEYCDPRVIVNTSKGFGSNDMSGDLGPRVAVETSKRTMILNNIVTVGHSDETTSESEGNEDGACAPVRFREQKKMTARERNERSTRARGDFSDSEGSSKDAPLASEPHKSPAQTVNLLDM